MNIHTRTVEQKPSRDQLNDAMRVLRHWVAHSDSEKIETLDIFFLVRYNEKM